jgi:predicted RNase H-like HicB family nuclease
MLREFRIVIHKAEEGGYYAECPLLRGCYTQGETLEETKINMREAIELYLEGTPIPKDVIEETLTLEVRYA